MIINRGTNGIENLFIALDGEVVGYVVQADTDEGYIIQAKYSPERQMFYGHETIRGKVAILGDIERDSQEEMLAALNKHRAELGMSPYPEFAAIRHPVEAANIIKLT
jgi:hypothetical protein